MAGTVARKQETTFPSRTQQKITLYSLQGVTKNTKLNSMVYGGH